MIVKVIQMANPLASSRLWEVRAPKPSVPSFTMPNPPCRRQVKKKKSKTIERQRKGQFMRLTLLTVSVPLGFGHTLHSVSLWVYSHKYSLAHLWDNNNEQDHCPRLPSNACGNKYNSHIHKFIFFPNEIHHRIYWSSLRCACICVHFNQVA